MSLTRYKRPAHAIPIEPRCLDVHRNSAVIFTNYRAVQFLRRRSGDAGLAQILVYLFRGPVKGIAQTAATR